MSEHAPARWIDLGHCAPLAFHSAYAGLAYSLRANNAPIVVVGRVGPHLCLGQSQGRCELDDSVSVPVVRRPLGGGAVWVDEDQISYAIVAPLDIAPSRHEDWYGWALAPAIATFASFGLPVTRVGEDLWLRGRKIAGSGAATLGRAAVVASSFLLRFPAHRFAASVASPTMEYRARLREGLALAMTDWASHADVPHERALKAAFALALMQTLGRSVSPSLPVADELRVIGEWREELEEPIESGAHRRVADGIKLNAELVLTARRGEPVLYRKGEALA